MLLKELRQILSADEVCICHQHKLYNFIPQVDSKNNNYISVDGNSVSMWNKFGEYKVEQLYDGLIIALK